MSFTLFPAVDVAGGAAVRLVQGAAGSETSYGDPLEAALAWQRDGAEWMLQLQTERLAQSVQVRDPDFRP